MSNGPEFFQTRMGVRFYEADVPRIARSMERIADALEKLAQTGTKDAAPAAETETK